jgi:hypothetical protein
VEKYMALALVETQTIIGINQEAWQEWVEFREQMKKPLSKLALKKSINFLLRYGLSEQSSIVDRSIMNDWRGLFPPDPVKKQSSRESDIYAELTDTSWAN